MISEDSLCEKHQLEKNYICINPNCYQQRIICTDCMAEHSNHQNDIFLLDNFKNRIKEQLHPNYQQNNQEKLRIYRKLAQKINYLTKSTCSSVKNAIQGLRNRALEINKVILKSFTKPETNYDQMSQNQLEKTINDLKNNSHLIKSNSFKNYSQQETKIFTQFIQKEYSKTLSQLMELFATQVLNFLPKIDTQFTAEKCQKKIQGFAQVAKSSLNQFVQILDLYQTGQHNIINRTTLLNPYFRANQFSPNNKSQNLQIIDINHHQIKKRNSNMNKDCGLGSRPFSQNYLQAKFKIKKNSLEQQDQPIDISLGIVQKTVAINASFNYSQFPKNKIHQICSFQQVIRQNIREYIQNIFEDQIISIKINFYTQQIQFSKIDMNQNVILLKSQRLALINENNQNILYYPFIMLGNTRNVIQFESMPHFN